MKTGLERKTGTDPTRWLQNSKGTFQHDAFICGKQIMAFSTIIAEGSVRSTNDQNAFLQNHTSFIAFKERWRITLAMCCSN